MVYMLLIYATEADWVHQTPEEMQPVFDAHQALEDDLRAAGKYLACGGLAPTAAARTLRMRNNQPMVVDGPFAETKELVAGFWLWQVKSMAEAIEWVKRCPNPMPGESEIEIRPVFEAEDFAPALTPELRAQEDRQRAQIEKLKKSAR